MSELIGQYYSYLQLLKEAKPAIQISILKHAPVKLICLLTAFAQNIINKNINVSSESFAQLRKAKATVYKIADRHQAAKAKRALLSNSKTLRVLAVIIDCALDAYDQGLLL